MKNKILVSLSLLITVLFLSAYQLPFPLKHLFSSINPKKLDTSFPDKSQHDLKDFFSTKYRTALQLGKDSDLELIKVAKDKNGNTHVKTQQIYHGIPVFGSWYHFHTKDGQLSHTNGKIRHDIAAPTMPSLSETEALNLALKLVPADKYAWQDDNYENALQRKMNQPSATFLPKGELMIVPNQLFVPKNQVAPASQSPKYHLCWVFNIYALTPEQKFEQVFINAENGNVVYQIPKISNCMTPGQGQAAYMPILVDIALDSCNSTINSTYQLYDIDRKIEVYNAVNTEGTPTFGFYNDSTIWIHPATDTVAVSAQWGLAQWYDYTLNQLNWQGLDNTPTTAILAWTHHGNNFENAFYDGFLHFGDGNPTGTLKRPIISLDAVAHECQHGVIEHTCNLVGIGEAGSLNEFLADFFACLVEWKTAENGIPITPDYIIGEDIVVGGIRRIDVPNLLGFPDTYGNINNGWNDQTSPTAGLHRNSTVASHCFYLLAEGGTGFSDYGTGYQVNGIGRNAVAELLFHTMRFYLTPVDGFIELRQATIAAASNLGWNQVQIDNLASAFCAVEIGGCSAQGTDTLTLLSPNGGEAYLPNDPITIEWENTAGVTGISILFSISNGAIWEEIENFIPVTTISGSSTFLAPNVSSDLCKIRIVAINDPLAFDVSDNIFSIKACDILGNFDVSPESGCSGTDFAIANTSNNSNVSWFVDGLPYPASPDGFSLDSPASGTHVITQVNDNGICLDTFSRSVFVAEIPFASFEVAVSNLLVTAVAEFTGGEQLFWSVDGQLLPAFNNSLSLNWTAPSTGNYTICLYIEDNCSLSGEEQCQDITIEIPNDCEGEEEVWAQYSNAYEIRDVEIKGDSLIISSRSGLLIYDRSTDEKTIINPINSDLPCLELGQMAADNEGYIYVILEKKGFLKINKNTFEIEDHFTQGNLEGLNSNQINVIEVDAQNQVWLGTDIGVWTGYPGMSDFTPLTVGLGLPHNNITAISFANNQVAWIGTSAGLAKVENLAVTETYTAENSPLIYDNIRAIYSDDTDVLVGSGGVFRLNNEEWTHYSSEDFGLTSIPTVLAINKGLNEKFYIGISVNRYVFEFDGIDQFIQYNQALQLKSGGIQTILPEGNDILVVGEERVLHWDTAENWEAYTTELFPFADNEITDILMISDGGTLITTGREMFRFENDTFSLIDYTPYLPSVFSPIFKSNMVEIDDGSIISGIGFSNNTLARYFPNNGAWQFIEENPDGLFFDPTVLAYHNGTLACGVFGALFLMDIQTGEGTFFNNVNSPLTSSQEVTFNENGTLYVSNGVYSIGNPEEGYIFTYNGTIWDTLHLPAVYSQIANFAFHPDGSIILQKRGGAPSFINSVSSFNPIDSSSTTLLDVFYFINDENNTNITEIAIDDQGLIYIGTSSIGAIVCNKEGEILQHYNTCNSGIPGNRITDIAFKEDGSIWFGSDNGIGVLYPSSQIIQPVFVQPSNVCENTTIIFNNATLGATEWEWRVDEVLMSTDKDFSYIFPTAGAYILELTAYNQAGCGISSSQSVIVQPKADLSEMPTEVISCDNSYLLCAPTGMASYAWKNGNDLISDEACFSFDQTNDGLYLLEVTDHCGKIESTIVLVSLTAECVYPGDVDNNGIVDFRDYLWVGFTYGISGSSRFEQGIEWKDYPALDWIDDLPNGTNYVHCDANGNRYIDLGDFEAIDQNYLETHGSYSGFPSQVPSDYSFVPVLSAVDTSLGNNQYQLTIDIVAQNADGSGINNFYSAGMRIYYVLPPGAELVGNPEFSFSNTSLGIDEVNTKGLVKTYADEQFSDIMLSRIDHIDQSGVTILGSGQFILITDNLATGDSLEFALSIENSMALSNTGNFIPISNSGGNFNFGEGNLTNTVDVDAIEDVLISPNPSSGHFNISLNTEAATKAIIQVFNTNGSEVFPIQNWSNNASLTLNLSNFPNGVYSIRVITEKGKSIQRLVKM